MERDKEKDFNRGYQVPQKKIDKSKNHYAYLWLETLFRVSRYHKRPDVMNTSSGGAMSHCKVVLICTILLGLHDKL